MSGEMNITAIKSDGSAGQSTDKDVKLLHQTQALLQADEHFQALKAPTLSKAEANLGQQDTEAGYLYLCYEVPGSTPQEFWAHWGTHNKVAWKSGQITVKSEG
jgi:hypothetical protein